MANDLVWACPRCGSDMAAVERPTVLSHWHCPGCGFDWVSGEALAAFLPTAKGFQSIRAAAVSGEPSTRALTCPTCRTASLRVVKAGSAVVDVCPKCVGMALDPGELRQIKSLGVSKTSRALDALDAMQLLDDILRLLC